MYLIIILYIYMVDIKILFRRVIDVSSTVFAAEDTRRQFALKTGSQLNLLTCIVSVHAFVCSNLIKRRFL